MQQLVLHEKIYSIKRIDETEYSSIAYERLEKIKAFNSLRSQGAHIDTICNALKVKQSTIYNWKQNYKKYGLIGLENQSRAPNKVREAKYSSVLENKVLEIRKQNPLYGKNKIKVILERDFNISASVSMVGRIISKFIKNNRIKSASFYYAKKMTKRRIFNNHAKRWTKDMKSTRPGELIQIDHMTVHLGADFTVKHFQAICPITKWVVQQAYSCATSNVASKFLDLVRSELPFIVKSIQVDGGSEFMGEFEKNCQNYAIPLYVIPPKSPEYNGVVERTNASSKFEFYYFYQNELNIASLRKDLSLYVKKFNTFRPHQSLHFLTPLQYCQKLEVHSNMY